MTTGKIIHFIGNDFRFYKMQYRRKNSTFRTY